MTTPFDYDADPERFRLATRVTRQHLTAPSLYELLAEALAELEPRRILDIGCGEGALRAALPARLAARTVGRDAAATMLGAHPPPVVQADATALPFGGGVFDVAVAVNVLDHLPEPTLAIAEAHRVLAAGGTLVAATASRHDSPELAAVWRPPPSSFDAEGGPGLVASVFGQVQVERWDAPLVRLPDRDAVRDYLIARFVGPEAAAAAAEREDSFRTRAARRIGDTTVAVVGGEVAGFTMVVGDEVEQVYVAAGYRGTGVADLLIEDAERQIRVAGHPAAWLAVVPGNARARRFYERRGWADAGPFDYAAEGERGPIPVPSHRYVKQLGPVAGTGLEPV